jgi:aminoglycoside phosphotransferase (APT) family kinase protein
LAPALAGATGDERWRACTAELISGGKSNITVTVRSDAGELVVRRPPTGELLPTAHDMIREARIQNCLADSGVPVPHIVLVDEGALLGVPCYAMEKVAGHVIRESMPDGWAETAAERRAMSHAFVDTLAALHGVDYEAVGLGDFGRPEGFTERQLRRWAGQWEKTRTRDVPEMEALVRRLAAAVPVRQRSTIIHGDFRTDNLVYDADDPGVINAVLDWELSSLGDPLTDLGLLMLYWREAGEDGLELIPGVSHLAGFATRAQLLERYATAADLDLVDLPWYEGFARFKFAAIVQGVSVRSKAGAMGGQDFGELDALVLRLSTEGLDIMKGH